MATAENTGATPSTTPTSSPSATTAGQRIEPLALFGTETVDNLTNGFLAILEPELVRVHKSLEELV